MRVATTADATGAGNRPGAVAAAGDTAVRTGGVVAAGDTADRAGGVRSRGVAGASVVMPPPTATAPAAARPTTRAAPEPAGLSRSTSEVSQCGSETSPPSRLGVCAPSSRRSF